MRKFEDVWHKTEDHRCLHCDKKMIPKKHAVSGEVDFWYCPACMSQEDDGFFDD